MSNSRTRTGEYSTQVCGNIEVHYRNELDGGGGRFGQDYVRFVLSRFGRVHRLFAWCCGPGFIGFLLLGHGLCSELVLADVNPDALRACRVTASQNGLTDCVTVFESDNFDHIPRSERWDLVVGNPHSGALEDLPHLAHQPPLLYRDPNWTLHRRFYASVGTSLRAGGVVAIQENSAFSSADTFGQMIVAGGLKVTEVADSVPNRMDKYYFIVARPV